jgi:hypothetical protein
VAVPAPLLLMDGLESVEVTHSDEARSGFEITFRVGRSGPVDLLDYGLLSSPLLKTFNRVILSVIFNATPRVLIDGVITQQQLSPANEPGASTLTITGEDLSVMMDLKEETIQHPNEDEASIARKLIERYREYGVTAKVTSPATAQPPASNGPVPAQNGTDLEYLVELADRFGYVFYLEPGPASATSTAYWGPPVRAGMPQSALSVNMGPGTNVDSLSFHNNALGPVLVSGYVQDSQTNQRTQVNVMSSSRPPLALSQPAAQTHIRHIQLRHSGLTAAEARARAQGMMDAASDGVSGDGELDALRYGGLLRARELVQVRGAGHSYDGLWYVKRVTHKIRVGSYKQSFTLTREGLGATT